MKNRKTMKPLLATLCIIVASGMAINASADTATMKFEQDSLTNVDDAAGRWQHEGGRVYMCRQLIGYYSIHRRVTLMGTTPQNTAMLTMTIFLLDEDNPQNQEPKPPQNVTIQGAHDFTSGGFIGSVSAASGIYNWLLGADVKGSTATGTLTLSW